MAKRIMLVDDEPNHIKLYQLHLEKAGYFVSSAPTGRIAVERIDRERPDLIIMDVNMPQMDGFEAVEQIRRTAEFDHIPVVLLTGRAESGDLWHGIECGAAYYLTKPINPGDLLGFVARLFTDQERRAA